MDLHKNKRFKPLDLVEIWPKNRQGDVRIGNVYGLLAKIKIYLNLNNDPYELVNIKHHGYYYVRRGTLLGPAAPVLAPAKSSEHAL